MVDKDRYKEVTKISLSEDDERDIFLIGLSGGNHFRCLFYLVTLNRHR